MRDTYSLFELFSLFHWLSTLFRTHPLYANMLSSTLHMAASLRSHSKKNYDLNILKIFMYIEEVHVELLHTLKRCFNLAGQEVLSLCISRQIAMLRSYNDHQTLTSVLEYQKTVLWTVNYSEQFENDF